MIKPSDRSNQPVEKIPAEIVRPGAGEARRIIIPGQPEPPSQPESSGPPAPSAPAGTESVPQQEALRPLPPRSPRPPRGARWRTLLTMLAGAILAFAVGKSWGEAIVSGARRGWHAVAGADTQIGDEIGAPDGDGNQYWTCGMHPWVILPAPGLCPICHMDLTPLDPAKLTGEITIDPVVVQNIGVRVAPVTTGPLTKEIRTVGTVAYDETATRDVNTKISGWIEKLYVDETGAPVERGQPLFELYSPELYQAQEEYLLALNGQSRFTRGLLEDARTKLQFFDIGPQQIRELEQRGATKKTLTVSSPHTGIVVEKNAHEGMKIDPGTLVYRIADLSSVWVIATLYEYQLPFIEVGQPAMITLPYTAGKTFQGQVAYVYPFLQEESRQVKVRLEFPNPDGELKPGMFATVRLENTLDQQAVLAPREAIISTGRRKVAFVSLGDGKFEPREVTTGVETEQGLVQILDGLEPDERVVTSGQFLLDSESKMRAALAKMVRGEMASDQPIAPAAVTGAMVKDELPPAAAGLLNELLAAYIAIGDALAADSTRGIEPMAQQIVSSVSELEQIPLAGSPDFWKQSLDPEAVRDKASQLADAKTLDAARALYAGLSQSLASVVEKTGVPASYGHPIEAMTCPMYPPKEGGAVWIQPAGSARNPYMGPQMLRCAGEREVLPVAGGEGAKAEQAETPHAKQP